MIPYLLAAVGGYLIGDYMKSQTLNKFADGGITDGTITYLKNVTGLRASYLFEWA